MKIVADLHIHSKYSRATSKALDLFEIEKWAKIKGVDLISCADFTHPVWFKHLQDNLTETSPGIYQIKNSKSGIKFFISTEISCIYSKNDKVRRQHIVLFSPSLEVAEKISKELDKIGKLKSDGRPILGLDAKELLKICLAIDEKIMVIPAHAWTPWFSIFGSKSGFDSLEECYEELTPYIYAIETGLSSDPEMNWLLSALDNITLISNSDAHSGQTIAREANVFDLDSLSYEEIYNIIKNRDKKKFLYTIEFFPEEGKYHLDGHRSCNVCLMPKETEKNKNICPVCKKPLTVGVLNRVEKLADRQKVINSLKKIPFKSLVPLAEIIAEYYKQNKNTKKVQISYFEFIEKGKSELNILLNLKEEELKKIIPDIIVKGILRVREGKVKRTPGYDGEFGKIKVFTEKELEDPQKVLF
jgi:uncharacterized protein (TIGR00375 family)